MTYVIGLTGNIASGKSTAAGMLQALGARVADADQVAHRLLLPGEAVYRAVVAHFGAGILAPDGTINRRALGAIVFADPGALAVLESLSHPAVTAYLEEWLAQGQAQVAVIEAIKLLEAGIAARCNAVWVVTTTSALQVQRLQTRGLTDQEIGQRIGAQPALYHKLTAAHVVLDNASSLAALRAQIAYAWDRIPDNHKE